MVWPFESGRGTSKPRGCPKGDIVEVRTSRRSASGTIDLEAMPMFQDADMLASVNHDRYLYG